MIDIDDLEDEASSPSQGESRGAPGVPLVLRLRFWQLIRWVGYALLAGIFIIFVSVALQGIPEVGYRSLPWAVATAILGSVGVVAFGIVGAVVTEVAIEEGSRAVATTTLVIGLIQTALWGALSSYLLGLYPVALEGLFLSMILVPLGLGIIIQAFIFSAAVGE